VGAKLNSTMDLAQIIATMAEGNQDAKEVASLMMRKSTLYRGVITCDKLGIRGEKLYKLYYICCDGNEQKMAKTLQMFENGVFSFEEIALNISLDSPEDFLDESIVGVYIPLYSDEFNITHPDWEEFAYLQRRNFRLKMENRGIN